MANKSGDIVTVLSLEDFEFVTGMRNAGKAARGMAGEVTHAGQQASSAWGRATGQMGFAAQDFASVYEMGGKGAMSRALMSTMNNVQMLGMSLGPWGMAITSVAGALGAILIPKLFEGGSAAEEFGKQIENTTKRMDVLISRGTHSLKFMSEIGELKSTDSLHQKLIGLDAVHKEGELEISEREERKAQIGRQIEDLLELKRSRRRLFAEEFQAPGATDAQRNEQLERARKTRRAIRNNPLNLLSDSEAMERKGQLEKEAADITEKMGGFYEKIWKNQADRKGILEAFPETLRKEMRDSRKEPDFLKEKFQDKLKDLVGWGKLGVDSKTIGSAMDWEAMKYAQSIPHPSHVLSPGPLMGSSAAVSAVNRAEVGDQDPRKLALIEARKMVELLRKSLIEHEAANRNRRQVVGVPLGGN